MKAYPHNSTTKRIFSGLLAVWMSGIVFLFCCGAPNIKAANEESCPLAKIGHCNKSSDGKYAKDANALNFETFENNGLAFDCCSFFPTIFYKARNVEKIQQIAEIPVKLKVETAALVFIKVKTNTSINYRPRLPNQSGTYLKNRVFRI